VTVALLATGGFFAINQQGDRGLVIESLALAFLLAEHYLAKHYRGYLHVVVERAKALESILRPTNSPSLFIDLGPYSYYDRMISNVVAVKRELDYSFLVAEAHKLLYLLLYGVDGVLIVFTLFFLNPDGFGTILAIGLGIVIFASEIFFLTQTRVGWKQRRELELKIQDRQLKNENRKEMAPPTMKDDSESFTSR